MRLPHLTPHRSVAMYDFRQHLLRAAPRLLFCLVGLAVATAAAAQPAVRVVRPNAPVFVLTPVATEDSTLWFDAEEWLRGFAGRVERGGPEGQLVYREGADWVALHGTAPHVVHNGRPLAGVEGVRPAEAGLQVSQVFLRQVGPTLIRGGYRLVTEAAASVRRIVLDAGHGGAAGGTRGEAAVAVSPLYEKEVALQLVFAMAERLRAAGYAVHLTRSGDHAISAAKRAGAANYWGGQLFLSVHVAGAGRPQARGFEVFVPAPPAADAAPGQWRAAQLGQEQQTRRWAEVLRAAFGQELSTFDRGISVLSSPLLEAVACPAVLVEVGTLAWPGDAALLTTAPGRQQVAEAVLQAADRYFNELSTDE